jgi:hypothetical protein
LVQLTKYFYQKSLSTVKIGSLPQSVHDLSLSGRSGKFRWYVSLANQTSPKGNAGWPPKSATLLGFSLNVVPLCCQDCLRRWTILQNQFQSDSRLDANELPGDLSTVILGSTDISALPRPLQIISWAFSPDVERHQGLQPIGEIHQSRLMRRIPRPWQ